MIRIILFIYTASFKSILKILNFLYQLISDFIYQIGLWLSTAPFRSIKEASPHLFCIYQSKLLSCVLFLL